MHFTWRFDAVSAHILRLPARNFWLVHTIVPSFCPIPLPALPAWFACFGQTTTQPGLKPGRPGSQATIFCLTGSAGLLGNQIPGVPRSGLAEHTSQGSKFLEVKHRIIKVNFDKYSGIGITDQQANILVSLPA